MRSFFMNYVQSEDRGQAALLPAAIEDYVAADAPVRVIDAFVYGLDVRGLGFARSVPAVTGRPPYDPRDLLKLYVYGYLNQVRSSRRLERECSRNVEVMWLLRRLAPDFKTIADFRRDNGAGIVGTCRAFVLFCRDQGLFTARLVALDGSKFRAAASTKRVMGRREIAEEATSRARWSITGSQCWSGPFFTSGLRGAQKFGIGGFEPPQPNTPPSQRLGGVPVWGLCFGTRFRKHCGSKRERNRR